MSEQAGGFANEQMNETDNYRCPSCGANMQYLPGKSLLHCEYCKTDVEISASGMIESKDLDFDDDTLRWDNAVRTFSCVNCGAVIELEKTAISATCSYCGSPNVVEEKEIKGIKPHALLPFSFDKKIADDKYHKWVKGKLFCPGAFKKNVKLNSLKGVYTPCWSFDAATFSTYEGVVGDRYTVTVKTKDGYRTETRIRYRRVRGTHARQYLNIMIESSPNITQKEFTKLLPYNSQAAVTYDPKYLSGFSADHYDKGLQPSWMECKSIIDANIRKEIIAGCNCDVVQYLNISTKYSDKKYKYMLVPVYVGGSKFKDKLYNFFMNGITGRTTGKTPVSPLRVSIAVLIGIAVVGAIGIAIKLFGG